jgi:hypothetical protein
MVPAPDINMDLIEDYYEILQVHHLAEPEVIEAAYKKLAQKYHPDINKATTSAAKMKKINEAHEVLSDSARRKEYDAKRLQGRGSSEKPRETTESIKPRPALKVLPRHIRFKNLDYDQSKTTHFDIENTGGPFTSLSVGRDRLPAWLEVTGIEKLGSQALPARVHIKVNGRHVGSQYESFIPVRIENTALNYSEEVQVRIEIAVAGPVLQIDGRFMEFNVTTDILPQPKSLRLINTGVGYIEGDLVPRQRWIKISPRHVHFDSQQEVQVQIDTANLVNNMMGYIDIKTNCASDVITIKATLVEAKKRTK